MINYNKPIGYYSLLDVLKVSTCLFCKSKSHYRDFTPAGNEIFSIDFERDDSWMSKRSYELPFYMVIKSNVENYSDNYYLELNSQEGCRQLKNRPISFDEASGTNSVYFYPSKVYPPISEGLQIFGINLSCNQCHKYHLTIQLWIEVLNYHQIKQRRIILNSETIVADEDSKRHFVKNLYGYPNKTIYTYLTKQTGKFSTEIEYPFLDIDRDHPEKTIQRVRIYSFIFNMLKKFLNFNHNCPVCEKPLQTLLSSGKNLWKSTKIDDQYHFVRVCERDKNLSDEDSFILALAPEGVTITFSTPEIQKVIQAEHCFCMKLCTSDAVECNSFDYDIKLDTTCYFRSSPFFDLVESNNQFGFQVVNSDHAEIVNRDIVFTVSDQNQEGLERVYLLNVSYEDVKTQLFHWSSTPEQRCQEGFEPNIFVKDDLPLLLEFPNLELSERDRLIDRLNSWVVLS